MLSCRIAARSQGPHMDHSPTHMAHRECPLRVYAELLFNTMKNGRSANYGHHCTVLSVIGDPPKHSLARPCFSIDYNLNSHLCSHWPLDAHKRPCQDAIQDRYICPTLSSGSGLDLPAPLQVQLAADVIADAAPKQLGAAGAQLARNICEHRVVGKSSGWRLASARGLSSTLWALDRILSFVS